MSNFDGMPGPSGPSINPFEYESCKCSSCGNEVFIPGIIMKKIPGILAGSSAEFEVVPIKVFICSKCGALSPTDEEFIKKEEKLSKKDKSSLIL